MPRVLAVIHTTTFGGPHNQMFRLTAPLAAQGWHTLVVLPSEPGNAPERLHAAGVPFIQIPLHRLRAKLNPAIQRDFLLGFAPEVAHIRRLIRDHQIDVVQVCGLMHLHGAIAAHLEGVPLVWQLLGTFAPYPLRVMLMPLVWSLADIVMSTGTLVARAHPGALSLGDRLIPFAPPVETSAFQTTPQQRAQARTELGVSDTACVIGTVGNFGRPKAHEFLVQAAAILHPTYPDVAVRVLGAHTPSHATYYQQEVKDAAHRLGLLDHDYLRFLEPGNRVAELLPAFDIFVLTSRQEGIPTVLLEAMASGLPAVSTNVGAVREVVEHGVTGFLVPPCDSESIALALSKLIERPALRMQMGRIARERAVEKYDIRVCVDTHIRAYEKALAVHQNRRNARRP